MTSQQPYLGVTASFTDRQWSGPSEEDDRMARAIAQSAGLHGIVGQILANRGVEACDALAHLNPSLRDLMPDPSRLRDMDSAAERFVGAIEERQQIAIFADYDVDGGASAALIQHWLRRSGLSATLYCPDRISEGYGPNSPAMSKLGASHDLIICVDCGTVAFDPISAAKCDVIVLDHHQGGETLPPALALVNPNRQDETGDIGYLCAAGVTFLFLVAVNRLLRARGQQGPDLMEMLDLVALATVADVAPLVGLNRAFVRQGLKVMAAKGHPGIETLLDLAGAKGKPNVYTLGFVLGPRINAGGRVGAADLGARLLATSDTSEAEALAERLEGLNKERRTIEAAVLAKAMSQAEQFDTNSPLIWAAGDDWHPGVIGIVAGRMKESLAKPSVVIALDGDDGKASARSVPGLDIGAAVARLAREGLIEKGGGHGMAAGLSLSRAQIEPAMERLSELAATAGAVTPASRVLRLDGVLGPAAATLELADAIAEAGPFGAGAPAPRLAISRAKLDSVRRVGDGHIALKLSDGVGGRLEGIAFRAFNGNMGKALLEREGARIHVAGRLERDEWGGRARAKLFVEDAADVKDAEAEL